MPYFRVSDGTELYYQTIGCGDSDIILIHGSFMNSNVWEYQLSSLPKDARVIAVDLRGHGKSEKPLGGYSLKSYANDIRALIDTVDADPVILVGWSLGAIVAVFTAPLIENKLSRLILISSGLFHMVSTHDDRQDEYIPFEEFIEDLQTARPDAMKWFVEMIFGKTTGQPTKDWIWKIALESALHANIHTMEAVAELNEKNLKDKLKSVDVPVGIFHGNDDLAAQPEEAAYVANKLVNEGILYMFEESGHLPFIEQPNEFNEKINKFLLKNDY